jgi:SP family sugar:H+ symporter-like MFS transporter
MFGTIIKKVGENPMSVLVSVFAAFGGFLFGYDIGTISGIIDMRYFLKTFGHFDSNKEEYVLESGDKSLIVSILSVGTFLGALLGYPSSDFLGRRRAFMLACFIFSIGVIFQTIATRIPLFAAGRVVAGIGVGIISCAVPIYQSECAPKWIRGGVVSTYQLFITIGLLIAAVVNNGTKDIMSSACYRIPIGIQLIWSVILFIGMIFLPESPRYLVLKGRIEEAFKCQARLTSKKIDDPQVDVDVKELIANTELLKVYGSGTYADCFKMGPQKNLLRTLVGIFLQAWQQLTGINFIFYYGTSFFHSLGISQPFLMTILTNLVNVIMTIPGILFIDKLGRRKILIIGAIGMLFSQYIIAIIGTIVGQSNDSSQKTLVVFVCIFIAFFASTWGPGAWVITSELYPISIRAKSMSLSTASNWLFNFLLGYVTPYMIDENKANMGSKVFFIWGSTCLGCLIFAIFCIWETKGLSLEQINYLVRNSSPLNSTLLNEQIQSGSIMETDMISGGSTKFPDQSADSF